MSSWVWLILLRHICIANVHLWLNLFALQLLQLIDFVAFSRDPAPDAAAMCVDSMAE